MRATLFPESDVTMIQISVISQAGCIVIEHQLGAKFEAEISVSMMTDTLKRVRDHKSEIRLPCGWFVMLL